MVLFFALYSQGVGAARPLDERDQLTEAHVFHIMFETRNEAAYAAGMLRNLPVDKQLNAFKEMAHTKSVDQGSRAAGGDLGVIRSGQLASGFEEVIFTLPLREVSIPVRSEYGWHVLYVESRIVKPIAQICEEGLRAYAKPADNKLAQALALSRSYKPDESGDAALTKILGPGWGKPVRDVAGNMRYFKGAPRGQAGVFDVSEHIEYNYAIYHAPKHACMRSSVAKYVVNCEAGTVTENGMVQYEMRAAQGRELGNIGAQAGSVLPFMYNDVYQVMHELVCHISNPANVAGITWGLHMLSGGLAN